MAKRGGKRLSGGAERNAVIVIGQTHNVPRCADCKECLAYGYYTFG